MDECFKFPPIRVKQELLSDSETSELTCAEEIIDNAGDNKNSRKKNVQKKGNGLKKNAVPTVFITPSPEICKADKRTGPLGRKRTNKSGGRSYEYVVDLTYTHEAEIQNKLSKESAFELALNEWQVLALCYI